MPVFTFQDPDTGREIDIEGEVAPSDAELAEIFSGLPAQVIQDASQVEQNQIPAQQEMTSPKITQGGIVDTLDKTIVGGTEAALSIGSQVLAEPLAGLAAIGKTGSEALFGDLEFFGKGAISTESRDAAKRIADTTNAVREAATFQPRTPEGKQAINAIGEFLAPVGEALTKTGKFFGDKVLKATGSPILAAIAEAVPEIGAEILSLGFGKGAVTVAKKGSKLVKRKRKESEITRELNAAIPTKENLFDASRAVFKELDESGVTVNQRALPELSSRVKKAAKEFGLDISSTPIAKIGQQNLPKASALVKGFNDVASGGRSISLTELDQLRKAAQTVADDVDPTTKAIGKKIIDTVDDFLDTAGEQILKAPKGTGSLVAKNYRFARNLWGRARRSEILQEAMEDARNQASGFENGIRIKFRQILNSKKRRKFFDKGELAAMRRVERGTPGANIAKLIGKFGFTDGKTTNFIGGSFGSAAGALSPIPGGIVIIPTIGTVSKLLAQKLTKGNAKFADEVIRAGKDARKITEAYIDIKNTPKGKRNLQELSQLLMRGDIDISRLPESNVKQAVNNIVENARTSAGIESPTPAPIQIQRPKPQQINKIQTASERQELSRPIPPKKSVKKANVRKVNPQKDSFLQAVAINGGINVSEVKQLFGLDKKDFSNNKLVPGKPILKNSGGRAIDDMAQALAEDGFIGKDANGKADIREFEERFFEEDAGNRQFSSFRDPLEDIDLDAEFEKFIKENP